MQLERQFAGPLQDTIIQRWRDPVDGMICYIYLPITAAHTPPTPTGYVQYGANTIGGISCLESTHTGTVPQAHAAKPTIPVPHAPKAARSPGTASPALIDRPRRSGGAAQRATTSTSPSTPVMTLKSRS